MPLNSNTTLGTKKARDFYLQNKKEIKAQKSPGKTLIKAAALLKMNIIVLNYVGEKKEFGLQYEHVMAYYLKAHAKRIMIIMHKQPTDVKKPLSTFFVIKYNENEQKVSFSYNL